MFRKISTILMAIAGITLIGFGAVTEASAYDDPCTQIIIESLGVERSAEYFNIWNYKFVVSSGTLDVSKLSLLSFGIDKAVMVDSSPNYISVQEPGQGAQADGWIEGVPQLQVITVPAQSYSEAEPLIIPVIGTSGLGPIAGHIKSGKNEDTCILEGPIPGLFGQATVPKQKIVNLLGTDFCVDINSNTGCPDPNPVVYECDNPNNVLLPDPNAVVGSTSGGDPVGPTTPTIFMGEGSDPRCPIGKFGHNPCEWFYIGGTAYGEYCW